MEGPSQTTDEEDWLTDCPANLLPAYLPEILNTSTRTRARPTSQPGRSLKRPAPWSYKSEHPIRTNAKSTDTNVDEIVASQRRKKARTGIAHESESESSTTMKTTTTAGMACHHAEGAQGAAGKDASPSVARVLVEQPGRRAAATRATAAGIGQRPPSLFLSLSHTHSLSRRRLAIPFHSSGVSQPRCLDLAGILALPERERGTCSGAMGGTRMSRTVACGFETLVAGRYRRVTRVVACRHGGMVAW